MTEYAFVVTQVGEKGSHERKRADEISDFVLSPVLSEFGMSLVRADRDPTPGQITTQLLRSLLEARLVVVDLTGRNANVYYELAIAHAFSKPTISIIDDPKNVAFDAKDERLIPIGKYESSLSVQQAEEAKTELRRALSAITDESFTPTSLVSEVASARSIDDLAPENPLASEVSAVREAVEEIRNAVKRPRFAIPPQYQAEHEQLKQIVETGTRENELTVASLQVDRSGTSAAFDAWLDAMIERVDTQDPWDRPSTGFASSKGFVPPPAPPNGFSDEPPF